MFASPADPDTDTSHDVISAPRDFGAIITHRAQSASRTLQPPPVRRLMSEHKRPVVVRVASAVKSRPRTM